MITQKLISLVEAMAIYEGWIPGESSTSKDGGPSVSYRNHNPGNLRSSIFQLGVRDGFAYFYNDDVGFFAMMYDIAMKCQGKTRTALRPDSKLHELIHVWSAGSAEGDLRYAEYVCKRTGFDLNMRIGDLIQ